MIDNAAIRAEIVAGARAADVARRFGLPLTAIHRIAYGRGKHVRQPIKGLCAKCGSAAERRTGPHTFLCDACKPVHLIAQSRATATVRKAVAIGMLKPVADRVCVDCGARAAHYDHRDYSKPLRVEPVCRGCNSRRGIAA